MVFGNDTHTLLVTRYDNLGKGASGAAVQCLNLMLGIDELNGLHRMTRQALRNSTTARSASARARSHRAARSVASELGSRST